MEKFYLCPHVSCTEIWNVSTWQIFLHGPGPWARDKYQVCFLPPPPRLAHRGRLGLDQPILDQTVSRCLKDVQHVRLDAALEKTTFLYTVFGKAGLLLNKQSFKPQNICDRNLRILHTFGNTLCCFVEWCASRPKSLHWHMEFHATFSKPFASFLYFL